MLNLDWGADVHGKGISAVPHDIFLTLNCLSDTIWPIRESHMYKPKKYSVALEPLAVLSIFLRFSDMNESEAALY